MLEEKLIYLKKKLVIYADLVEDAIKKAEQGILEKREDLLNAIIDGDEPKINAKEIEIDELCMGLMAQLQPKGKSLRTIMMAAKVNSDLERIGDQVVNIAESGKYLISHTGCLTLVNMSDFFKSVVKMYRNSILAFVNEDAHLARQVRDYDQIVDDFNYNIFKTLAAEMVEDPKVISPALHLMRVARNLERIADHATNIAEDVVYMVEGLVLKHHHPDE